MSYLSVVSPKTEYHFVLIDQSWNLPQKEAIPRLKASANLSGYKVHLGGIWFLQNETTISRAIRDRLYHRPFLSSTDDFAHFGDRTYNTAFKSLDFRRIQNSDHTKIKMEHKLLTHFTVLPNL